jgi:uncharacterized protein
MPHKKLDLFLKGSYSEKAINAVLHLTSEGCTIPFIARYRKELTGQLDEVGIRDIIGAKRKLEEVIARQKTIISAIEEQGLLTERLKQQILSCFIPMSLEDIYLPFKKRRKTKADVARDNGLEDLAKIIMSQGSADIKDVARKFISSKVSSIKDAIEGAQHIIAEWINTDQLLRETLRSTFEKHAILTSRVKRGKKDEAQKYRDFHDYSEKLQHCPSYRFLAVLRGEKEGFLQVSILPEEERTLDLIKRKKIKGYSPAAEYIETAILDAYKRLLAPSLENQTRQHYKEIADRSAIDVFAQNVRQLLLSPPLGERATLAIDPGFRTGCKVTCLDKNGKLMKNFTIYPHPPQQQSDHALEMILSHISKYHIEAIAVGDGTAGKETLTWLRKNNIHERVEIHLVNEDGASIYSASEYARQEFPDYDITVRGAISIGRRLMDPLAELIKIDAKSIGVGQYQHDVNQKWLDERLDEEVISCVNSVGVNLNTASSRLLEYISGLGPTLAANIVEYRDKYGPFVSRKDLKKVPRLGDKAYEQASGFLRIRSGESPLDNTGVHPESYALVEKMCKRLNATLEELIQNEDLLDRLDPHDFVNEVSGLPTIIDIIEEMKKPGLDSRGQLDEDHLQDAINDITDLNIGMPIKGKVKNITDFGAFVDIGIKEAGLVHISEIDNQFIKHPSEKLHLNQTIEAEVIGLDLERRRIQLSIKKLKKS